MRMLAPLFVLGFAATLAQAGTACTFVANCDYGKGSRDSAKVTTKEECCAACEGASGCVAGVFDGTNCWFKDAAAVTGGCQHSSRAKFACLTAAAPTPPAPPPPPTPHFYELEKQYGTLQNTTCATVVAKLPALPASDETAFLAAYKNAAKDDAAATKAAAVLLDLPAVKAFLSAPDSFAAKGGLDADMVLCAVMHDATPAGLAEFAAASQANEDLVGNLLKDTVLMRDMLVAGGAARTENDKGDNTKSYARYGQAYSIYTKILATSDVLSTTGANTSMMDSEWDDRSQANILKRCALGTALLHAIPLHLKYANIAKNEIFVDPVERYTHYEKAYQAGELDPSFEVLTAFECRHTTNSHATSEDLIWFRKTLANYRPDHITIGGQPWASNWRYARAVKTEVAYGDPMCALFKEGICNGHYAEIPASDGVCGPRAFFGRYTREAFGMPTWGATQPGHAAMTTWSPAGWSVLLGASWPSCWWSDQGGVDWYLNVQAREIRSAYQQVLRGNWAGKANFEAAVPTRKWGGSPGTWSALMLYAKKIAVAANTPPTPRAVGKSLVPTKVEALVAKWKTPLPTAKITPGPDGTITIPGAAFSAKNRSASLSIMHSADAGTQVIHGGCASAVGPPCLAPESSAFEYEVTVGKAGAFYLTANHTTWHPNQDLFLSLNGAAVVTVPVYYTVGWWNETQPITLQLVAGKNTLRFTRKSVKELVFKEFFLFSKKPVVPPPPGNYTPTPAPNFPPSSAYIEVPADTTCIKQGITPVNSADCSRACLALGFKGTGPRARANISGCFVMTEGQYKGNCNYNTNTSATCTPPCTLMGSIVRSLCIRK